jgi:hypothetical protein
MRAGCTALLLALAGGGACRSQDDQAGFRPPSVIRDPRDAGPSMVPRALDAMAPPYSPPAAAPDAAGPMPMPMPMNDAATAGPSVRADAAAPPMPLPPVVPGVWWRPAAGATWDWQLKTPIDPSFDVQVYDIDLFENEPAVMADLKARGRKVICYVNLGAFENWRPDADRFPRAIIGAPYHGFPDENWLDIRRLDLLAPIVRSRLDLARAKGCDAVEPDNMDGYDVSAHEPSGFPLTHIDQLVYNRFVASEAHRRGLAVGLKNDVHQVQDLVSEFDFHVSEQCYEHNECQLLLPFIAAGKPVFLAEYVLPLDGFCPMARAARISAIRKRTDLDSWRELCP